MATYNQFVTEIEKSIEELFVFIINVQIGTFYTELINKQPNDDSLLIWLQDLFEIKKHAIQLEQPFLYHTLFKETIIIFSRVNVLIDIKNMDYDIKVFLLDHLLVHAMEVLNKIEEAEYSEAVKEALKYIIHMIKNLDNLTIQPSSKFDKHINKFVSTMVELDKLINQADPEAEREKTAEVLMDNLDTTIKNMLELIRPKDDKDIITTHDDINKSIVIEGQKYNLNDLVAIFEANNEVIFKRIFTNIIGYFDNKLDLNEPNIEVKSIKAYDKLKRILEDLPKEIMQTEEGQELYNSIEKVLQDPESTKNLDLEEFLKKINELKVILYLKVLTNIR